MQQSRRKDKRTVRRDQVASRGTTASRKNKSLAAWIGGALFIVAILPYLQTFGYDFTRLDDGVYVADNSLVHQGLTWSNLAWAFTTTSTGNWHPITWLSHMLDCQLFGVRPGWHHLMNAFFHGANSLLLFVVLRTLTGSTWRSAFVTALFAMHPVHVESVAWIAERKDVLSTFFGLLAIGAYAIYVRAPSLKHYALVACFFALSLLSKPMLVTLPFVLLLLDVWPLRRFSSANDTATQSSHRPATRTQDTKPVQLILEKLPLLLLSITSSVIAWKAQQSAGAMAPVDIWPLSQRLANAIVAYIRYLSKAFWPVDLAVVYPFPDRIPVPITLFALMLIAGITVATLVLMRNRPWLPVGWLWYLGTLVPVIGLVQVGAQSMADRYTYFPLIGVFIMIAWSLPSTALTTTHRGRTISAAAVGGLILIALSARTFAQVQLWKTSTILFEHAVNVTDGNYMAQKLLAGALMQDGKLAEAKEHLETSLRLRPSYADAHHDLGTILVRQKDFQNAKEQFLLALKTKPSDPFIWNALGLARAHLGEMDQAISDYRYTLTLNPNYAYALANLGAALLTQGKNDEAINICEKALQLQPNNSDTHTTLGAALWNRGQVEESIQHNRKAIELNPDSRDARFNLALALSKNRKYDEAIDQLKYLLRLQPDDKDVQSALTAAEQERTGGTAP